MDQMRVSTAHAQVKQNYRMHLFGDSDTPSVYTFSYFPQIGKFTTTTEIELKPETKYQVQVFQTPDQLVDDGQLGTLSFQYQNYRINWDPLLPIVPVKPKITKYQLMILLWKKIKYLLFDGMTKAGFSYAGKHLLVWIVSVFQKLALLFYAISLLHPDEMCLWIMKTWQSVTKYLFHFIVKSGRF